MDTVDGMDTISTELPTDSVSPSSSLDIADKQHSLVHGRNISGCVVHCGNHWKPQRNLSLKMILLSYCCLVYQTWTVTVCRAPFIGGTGIAIRNEPADEELCPPT